MSPIRALRATTREGIAEIVIDNPAMKNAFTAEMWRELPVILAALDEDDDTCVALIRGNGENFSSGADIGGLDEILFDPTLSAGGLITAADEALASFRKPVIAVVDGYCVGGGWEVAAACDLRIASDRARFAVTPAKLGITYPLSGVERLVRLAGPAVAKRLLLTAESISAAEALRLGLVTEVVSPSKLRERARERAARMMGLSQLSLRAAKEVIDACASGHARASQADERWLSEIAASDDYSEGVSAFQSSRAPVFRWRRAGTAV